jgi:hypothetical protein
MRREENNSMPGGENSYGNLRSLQNKKNIHVVDLKP